METNQNLFPAVHFRYMTAEEFNNPFSYVYQLFRHETDIDYLREDITDLIRSAFSDQDAGILRKGRFQEYAFTQRRLIKMMETAFRIMQITPEIIFPEDHPWQTTLRQPAGPDRIRRPRSGYFQQFQILNYEEIIHPVASLTSFFSYRTLEEWREILDDLLGYAYDESDPIGSREQGHAFKIMDELERLTETLYVIYEIRIWNDAEETIEEDERDDDDQPPINNDIPENSNTEKITDVLSPGFQKAVSEYFERFSPDFLITNYRHLFLKYLEIMIAARDASASGDLPRFSYQMAVFLELLDAAKKEFTLAG